jgi:hypothetical protein
MKSQKTNLTPSLNKVINAPIPDTDPLRRNHLIYSYFIESTGIVEVFRKLFTSFLLDDEILKLNVQEDSDLIRRIKENIKDVYSKSSSSIAPDPDKVRRNAYWRLFGYTLRGKGTFPNGSRYSGVRYNAEFNKTFESVMVQIFQIILDKGITLERLGNANALAELLDNLKRQLVGRTYNTIEDISQDFAFKFYSLSTLLGNNKLMIDRLSIRSNDPTRRLIELGKKLKVPVAKESSYLFLLASRMNIFLRKVEEEPEWTPQKAKNMVSSDKDEVFFKEIQNAWYQVTGKDFLAEAMKARRRRDNKCT